MPQRLTDEPDATKLAKLEEKLADPMWRLCSGELYRIAPADGSGIIPYHPRLEQIEIYQAILDQGGGASRPQQDHKSDPASPTNGLATHRSHPTQDQIRDHSRPFAVQKPSTQPLCAPTPPRLLIPKARRLGISTALGIFLVDQALFRRGLQCSLIDRNSADASKKLDRIMRVALDNLPAWLAPHVARPKDNDSQLSVSLAGREKSDIYAGMNARGSSNDLLWISEWGVIQMEDPKRSAKIRTGALPSARHGITVIETTWKGGKGGDVWDLLEPALTGAADDWRVLFFPWWRDPRNVAPDAAIDTEAETYFQSIAERADRDGIQFSDAQRRWWARERREQGIFMTQENPTFLDECWSAPVKGAIYGAAIDRARTEGRIAPMPVAGDALVHTSWDLGAPQNTVVWYWQVVGREIRIIDCDRNWDGTIIERVAMMLAKGYSFGTHFLPHDAQQTERSGRTLLGELRSAGLGKLATVPRTHSVWVGINRLLQLFPALQFRNTPQVQDGLDALTCYRQREPGNAGGGNSGGGASASSDPVHDWSSHTADALRTMAEAHQAGLFKFGGAGSSTRNAERTARRRKGMKPMRVSG